jgi:hypothetical protein
MKRLLPSVLSVLLLAVIFVAVGTVEVKAAPFTRATIRYDRMMTNKLSSLQVIVVPASVGTEAKVVLVFASASVSVGQSASTTNIPSYATALPGVGTTAVGAGTSIAVPCSDLTVGSTYAYNLTVGVTTPGAGAYLDKVQTWDSGNNVIDSTTVTSRIISNDQVVITANVPSNFTFVLSGNTDAFTSDLSSGAVAGTAGISVAVSTNASKGWIGWVKSANTALSSVTTGESIGTSGTYNSTPETCQTGTDCYVLDVGVTSGTGTGALTADPEYAGNWTSTGGTLMNYLVPFAARTGKTNGDTVWLKALATMTATKAAGSDYTDTWTVVGAGNF